MRELQKEIIELERTKPTIEPEHEVRRSVDFLKDYLQQNPGLKTYVLGISGGQDSTLAGKLAQMAISELRTETGAKDYQFVAVRLPYGEQADEQDALDAIKFIQADMTMVVNIKPSVDALVEAVTQDSLVISDFNKGNIKARARMVAQYAIAGQMHGAVIGTDHAAENVTGFFTKYGDGGADLLPLAGLNKRQGKALLSYLKAPSHLYEKKPTADLEEKKPLLPDEEALGVTYDQIDDYLEGRRINGLAAEKIEHLYLKSEHKRHLPVTPFER